MRMETGVCVLHLFCRVGEHTDADAVRTAIAEAKAAELQVVTSSVFGHKAELALMVIGADVTAVQTFQRAVAAAGLQFADSYLSITEVSEYAPGLPAEMVSARLYPVLPPEDKSVFCFYPMSKRREAHANWYAISFEERRDMMYEHGTSGRKYAGKLVQLITSSTGLDEYEWGVTLFGINLEVIKDVVYTLRFDEASALYGDFGTFYVGLLADIDELLPANS